MSAVVFSVPRSLILVLVLPLISLEHAVINAQNSFLNFNCSITNGLYPGIQSPFFTNLNHLLFDLLYEEGNHSRFSIQKAGEDPDSVYGSYLCRGDLSPQWCQFCIRKAGEDVLNRCLNYKGAIIWYDGCTIRYSTSPITRDLVIDPVSCMHDWRFLSKDDVTFSAIVNSTLRNLRLESIFPFTNMYYASDELHISESANLYGMVQCVPNMVRSDCLHCLDFAIDMVLRCSNGRMGGSVLTPSCVVTYGDYSFYWEAFGAARQAHGSSSKKRRKWGRIAICGSISAFLIVLLRYLGSYYWRITQKEDGKEDYSTTVESLELAGRKFIIDFSRDECLAENLSKCQELPTISLDQVRAATGHFSEESKLGKGGFGVVYKGTLLDGKEIAVKRLSRTSTQGIEEFKNEVSLIARLQHRNLVKLLGCCLEDSESLLIYEYMPNKSLDFFLFDATKGGELDWKQRLIIIKGIARGILYLHEDSRLRIVHRDLKTSNILLDHEMNPKISDFGLARIFEANQSIANTRRVVGTYGYMAPEYAMEGVYSVKSDVFSFGVLLLEIISGKKNSGFYLHEHDHNLLTFAWELWSEGRGLELLDSALEQSFVGDEVLKCIHIGLLCVQYNPADRPTMSSVVLMLAGDSMTLCQPMKPAFAVGCLLLRSLECASDAEGVTANGMTISDVTPR